MIFVIYQDYGLAIQCVWSISCLKSRILQSIPFLVDRQILQRVLAASKMEMARYILLVDGGSNARCQFFRQVEPLSVLLGNTANQVSIAIGGAET